MKPIFIAIALFAAAPAAAHSNKVSMEKRGDQLCFTSNGAPNHDIGSFPNRGNPHRFRQQTVRLCVDATPRDTGRLSTAGTSGVTLTGIPIRPGTADYYDRSSPRGHSRDRASGWNLEGMGAAETLGMDKAHAHVDERGLYHYHGVSAAGVLKASSGTLLGYAADGFEIHYGGKGAKSSWQLKKGTRPSGPGGRHDGTYVEDWEYVRGSGNLDQCNGGKVNGRYVYFATHTFPFYPRCFRGTVSADFKAGG